MFGVSGGFSAGTRGFKRSSPLTGKGEFKNVNNEHVQEDMSWNAITDRAATQFFFSEIIRGKRPVVGRSQNELVT